MVPALGAGFDTLKDAQLAILCLTIDITYMKVLGPCVCCGSAFPPYAICDDDLCNELFLVCLKRTCILQRALREGQKG